MVAALQSTQTRARTGAEATISKCIKTQTLVILFWCWCLFAVFEYNHSPPTIHHSDCVKCPFIFTSACTSEVLKEKSQVNDCFCPWYFFTTSLDDPLIIYYHWDSCWETNRTDLKDLFPSPPVQRLLTCLANYDLFTDWPISHSIIDQHENPVSSLEVTLGQKVSSYGRTQWTCRSNASVQPWPRRPFS